MADYWDELEPVDDVQINRSAIRRKWIASKLSDSTLEKISRIAAKRNLSAADLIQQWLEERIALEEAA
jgi:flagellar biosynthesis/type III secretory pathway M-ring protein FliF/YscJ